MTIRRPHSANCIFALCLLAAAPHLFAQGARMDPRQAEKQQRDGSPREEKSDAARRDHRKHREAWFRSGRATLGERSADLLHRAYRQKSRMRIAAQFPGGNSASSSSTLSSSFSPPPENGVTAFSNLTWVSMGPAPAESDRTNFQSYGAVTGRVTSVIVDQKDATGNTIYIGGAFGGVWRSTNAANSVAGNVTWQPLLEDQPTLAVGAIALQPNGNVILVGTGEPNSSADSYYGMGILRSADSGATWQAITAADGGTRPFRGLGFSKIAFSTANTNLVVAAAAGTLGASNGAELSGTTRGIYYSTDAGATWQLATARDGVDIAAAGSVSSVVFNPQHGKFYAALRFHGYYTSTDGANWTRLPDAQQPNPIALSSANCPAVTNTGTCALYRGEISVHPTTGEVYTIWVDPSAETTTGGGVYRLSANNGTWTKLGQAGIDSCGDDGNGCGTDQGTYNLTIATVPNGTTTDLYMGAINLFKCNVNATDATCSAAGAWKNLTHVYGCGETGQYGNPAHVHPDQHAIDFLVAEPAKIFFGNDGGVYRSLNGPGLNSGSCTVPNPFDNLNSRMGSLSQFVDFSQHPTNPDFILGGLQDNGSPLRSTDSLGWIDVNSGDGGYNAIDAVNPNVLYTSNVFVSVQRCTAGANCNNSDFQYVVESGQLGGDGSAFYTPFTLDRSDNSRLLIATCRVWRGAATGGTYTQVSNNFATGTSAACSGGTFDGDTKIRSLAAGGPAINGNSQVIYAGMVGRAGAVGGHIFVTTSSDSGAAGWVDRTGTINPGQFDVSDIAISPHDATGQTAYITFLGFGNAHIFKTTNAGANWTNKTANLPDAPANSVLVDPADPNIIYIGTDVGVFVSTDDGATWGELGLGLPNVPAIKLSGFVQGATRKIRVATYGRGLWQTDLPALGLSLTPSLQTFSAVVGRSAKPKTITIANNSGTSAIISSITASGDFSQTNDCPGTLAVSATCTATIEFLPAASGSRPGTLAVNSSATGSPHSATLDGTGVDFQLALGRGSRAARPGAEQIFAGQSASFELQLSSSYSGTEPLTVPLVCEGAPAGSTCTISPRHFDLSRPQAVKITVKTTASGPRSRRLRTAKLNGGTPAGMHTITIKAGHGAGEKTLPLSFRVR